MADLAWKQTAPGVEEADGPGGARFVLVDQPGFFDVTVYLDCEPLELNVGESRRGARRGAAKSVCQRLADWASGTKREGANRG